ncbi:MAG: STAS domain-containing protein [Crocosphaera sp.]
MKTDIQVYQPSGILDGTKSHQFRQHIQKLIEAKPRVVVIDFKDVSFMDSSGLGALVLSLKTVRAAGSRLFLCSLNEQIMMLLELTDMHKVFKIFESREELEKEISHS